MADQSNDPHIMPSLIDNGDLLLGAFGSHYEEEQGDLNNGISAGGNGLAAFTMASPALDQNHSNDRGGGGRLTEQVVEGNGPSPLSQQSQGGGGSQQDTPGVNVMVGGMIPNMNQTEHPNNRVQQQQQQPVQGSAPDPPRPLLTGTPPSTNYFKGSENEKLLKKYTEELFVKDLEKNMIEFKTDPVLEKMQDLGIEWWWEKVSKNPVTWKPTFCLNSEDDKAEIRRRISNNWVKSFRKKYSAKQLMENTDASKKRPAEASGRDDNNNKKQRPPVLSGEKVTEESLHCHTELRGKIAPLETVQACFNFYTNNMHFRRCHHLPRQARKEFINCALKKSGGDRAKLPREEQEKQYQDKCGEWAEHLVQALESDEKRTGWAAALEQCRETVWLLLLKVLDLAFDDQPQEGLSCSDELKERFGLWDVGEILDCCLVMERAKCLFSGDDNGEIGLGWYSESDAVKFEAKYHKLNRYGPTIDKRLCWLVRKHDCFSHLRRWVDIAAPPRLESSEFS